MILIENGKMARDDICRRLGFEAYIYEHIQGYPDKRQRKSSYHKKRKQYKKRTTVYDNLEALRHAGYVKFEFKNLFGRVGRPTTYWSVIGKNELL